MDLRGQWAPLHDQITAAVGEVITSGVFILGPNVKAFEAETAADLGVAHAVGVASLLAIKQREVIESLSTNLPEVGLAETELGLVFLQRTKFPFHLTRSALVR